MELLKKNVHMERISSEATIQTTLEDDLNIPENKPDVNTLNLEKATITIEEIKPGTDMVSIRGKMNYCLLYHTLESGSSLVSLQGSVPFEEKINMQGVIATDNITVEGDVDDITMGIINSRKLSIQSVITLHAWVENLYDEELPMGLHGAEQAEYRRMPMNPAQVAIHKNDVFRLKEEVSLPSNYPNIFQILWDSIYLGDVEFKVMQGKISLQGDIHLFLLYEGEGEDHPVRSFETTIPFSGVLECYGCREGMIPDIRYRIGQQELSVKPDFDGEERNVGMELTMDIAIRIYEEEEMELVTDIYGVTKEVETVTRQVGLKTLLAKVTGKTKVTDRMRIESGNATILQLLHSEGEVMPEKQQVVENGILLQGNLSVKVMYITGDDGIPYACTKAQIPYHYTLEIPGVTAEDMGDVQAGLEQLQVTMLDGEEMDVKAILSFRTTLFRNICLDVISRVNVSDLDSNKLNQLPGMVIYTVKAGDNLWNIGKRYYVSVDAIKELNGLSSDDLQIGQKLLIAKCTR